MNNRLSLQDLAGLLASKTGKTKKDSEQFLREFITIVYNGAFADRVAKISGLGTFKIIRVEDRESINVNTGERFIIPGHYRFNFSPDRELKELVNKPFSFFETTEINDGTEFPELVSSQEDPDEEGGGNVQEEIVVDLPVTIDPEPTDEIVTRHPELEIEKNDNDTELAKTITPIIPPSVKEKGIEKKKKERKKGTQKTVSSKTVILSIFVFVLIALSAGGYFYKSSLDKQKKSYIPREEEQVIEAVLNEMASDVDTTKAALPEIATQAENDSVIMTEPVSKELTRVIIEAGSRLTLISLENYGHKIFWVYIYEHNKDKIEDPNNIPVGTELIVPVPALYGINAKDRSSIEKAIVLQAEILNDKK